MIGNTVNPFMETDPCRISKLDERRYVLLDLPIRVKLPNAQGEQWQLETPREKLFCMVTSRLASPLRKISVWNIIKLKRRNKQK
jgi:hypothetical protein